MKICILTTSFPRYEEDDAGIFIQRLALSYKSQGIDICVIIPRDQNEALQESSKGLRLRRFSYTVFANRKLAFGSGIMPNLRKYPWLILQVPGLFLGFVFAVFKEKNNIDIIHAQWLVNAIPAYLCKILFKKPYIITLRGEDLRLLNLPFFRFIFSQVIKQALFTTTVSQDAISKFRKKEDSKLYYVPNGVEFALPSEEEVAKFKNEKNYSQEFKYIIFVGSIIPRKRIDVLVDILSYLPDYTLILCGRTDLAEYLEEIKLRAENAGCLDRIKFEGQVNPILIPKYLGIADCYLSASEHEGRPNAVLEALYLGCPVVLSDILAHRELVSDEKSGLLFDIGEPKMAAKQIQGLLGDKKLKTQIIAAGRQSVADYSWANCAARYINLIERHRR